MRALEVRLYDLALLVRDLLGCSGSALTLRASDTSLCHPLLPRVVQSNSPQIWGSLPADLFTHERVRAACDIAQQTGHLWHLQGVTFQDTCVPHFFIVPLECSAGQLGLLFCAMPEPETPLLQNKQLLLRYIPIIAGNVERILQEVEKESGATTDGQRSSGSSEFISMLSHELRSPLTSIKGYATLLQTYGSYECHGSSAVKLPIARQRHYVDAIVEQTTQLEMLINDLLDVSRLRAGRLTLRRSRVDVGTLSLQVVQTLQTRIERDARRALMRCCVDPELPLAWADSQRVRQVLNNLLENALKYAGSEGTIVVEVTAGCPCALQEPTVHPHSCVSVPCITVRDNGPGISTQQQQQLFQPFARGHEAAIPGSGLGLYISRRLVEAMHGQIKLWSNPGYGTSVTFTLPAVSKSENSCVTRYSLL